MNGCQEQYANTCMREFAELQEKLDRVDEAIRGNGKPGIHLRLDRLEQSERRRSRIVWLIIGCAVTLAAAGIWHRVFG